MRFLCVVILVWTLLLGKIADRSNESWFKSFSSVSGSHSANCNIFAFGVKFMLCSFETKRGSSPVKMCCSFVCPCNDRSPRCLATLITQENISIACF